MFFWQAGTEGRSRAERIVESWMSNACAQGRHLDTVAAFFGRIYSSVIAEHGPRFEHAGWYRDHGYKGFAIDLGLGVQEDSEMDDEEDSPKTMQSVARLDQTLRKAYELRSDRAARFDFFEEFLAISEIDPSRKTSSASLPRSNALHGLIKSESTFGGPEWFSGPLGVGLLVASFRQSLEARTALSAVTPIVDLLINLPLPSDAEMSTRGLPREQGLKLFLVQPTGKTEDEYVMNSFAHLSCAGDRGEDDDEMDDDRRG